MFIKSQGKFNNSNFNEAKALELLNKSFPSFFPSYMGSFEFKSEPIIIMEKLSGERLDKIIAKNYEFSLYEIKNILSQFVSILDILYEHKIIHRDIRPQNIIINKLNGKAIVKLFDFSFSITPHKDHLQEVKGEKKEFVLKNLGTQKYRRNYFYWDDAYSFMKISQDLAPINVLENLSEYKEIKKRIGRLTYKYMYLSSQ